MRRILFCSALIVSLLILQPAKNSIADEKPGGWRTVKGVQMLRLWEQPSGLNVPQAVILKLSSDQFAELEKGPLDFYKKYDVFPAPYSDRDQGHAIFNLQASADSKDGILVFAVHDASTYSAFAGFQYRD